MDIKPRVSTHPAIPLAEVNPPYDYGSVVLRALNKATGQSLTVDGLNDGYDRTLADAGLTANTAAVHLFRQELQYLFQADVPLSLINASGTSISDIDDYIFGVVVNLSIFTPQSSPPGPTGPPQSL